MRYNATTETAARGYEIFLSRKTRGRRVLDVEVTLDDINRQLDEEGREPIHQRSLYHYGNLLNSWLLNYMPINQFDVQRQMGLV
jgi:hypothetical protein